MRPRRASRFTSRKFFLAAWFSGFGTVGWLWGKMDGPTYVALATLVLAAYGAANVAARKAGES